MKKFFIVFCLICFGSPTLAYIDGCVEERLIVRKSKGSIFKPFINGATDKITELSCNKDKECINITFYKIDNSLASTNNGSILNYRTLEFLETRPMP